MKNTTNRVVSALFLLVFSWGQTACQSDYQVVDPNFDVAVASTTVRAGEPVTFNLSGDPDIITFYSGEKFNEYAHRNEDRVAPADIYVTFNHKFSNSLQSTVPYQICQFASKFMYSKDFSGKLKEGSTTEYDLEAIEAATWIDMSDQLTYTYRMNQFYGAGNFNFTEIFGDGEEVYFGFYYIVVPNNIWDRPEDPALDEALGDKNPRSKYPKYPIRRMEYYVQAFDINTISPTDEFPIPTSVVNMANMGWKRCKIGDYWSADTKDYPTISASAITFTHSQTNPAGYCQAWAISKPIQVENQINYGTDKGKGIKSFIDNALTTYQFTYNTPGKYTVTFVAKNATAEGSKELVRELEIIVQ